MKSKQVLSVEQMKHLQELGLDTSDGSMCFEWNESDSDNMVVTSPDADTNYDYYHETYTLQDILDKLPPVIKKYYWLAIRVSAHKGMWYVEYNGRGCTLSYFYSEIRTKTVLLNSFSIFTITVLLIMLRKFLTDRH